MNLKNSWLNFLKSIAKKQDCCRIHTCVVKLLFLQKTTHDITFYYIAILSCLPEIKFAEEKIWHKLREKTEKDNSQRKREEDTESKLFLLKRQTEKASIDKKQLVEEKKQQVYIYFFEMHC